MITSGGVDGHARIQAQHRVAEADAVGALQRPESREYRVAGIESGLLDLFIRYRPLAWAALIVALLLGAWLGDGGNASW